MPTESSCRITTKDLAILETMLDRYRGSCPHYANLLRHKIRASEIYLRDDIPPDVVTLNSQVAYRIDGHRAGPHLLVQSQVPELPGFALSIHSLRGLALLGMSEGHETLITSRGGTERLLVDEVRAQPEARSRSLMRA
ncbi:MAG: hypothetical protein M9939_08100 [Mesorhizobium sp.]|nr:hypothetical protein [Mesorhizobium sp.]MCO5161084.1 hypothetical protein [Mesorhizobium sp.]